MVLAAPGGSMELGLGREIAEFRAETRDWIAEHAPAGLAELAGGRLICPG